jgi:hypothetical protein
MIPANLTPEQLAWLQYGFWGLVVLTLIPAVRAVWVWFTKEYIPATIKPQQDIATALNKLVVVAEMFQTYMVTTEEDIGEIKADVRGIYTILRKPQPSDRDRQRQRGGQDR